MELQECMIEPNVTALELAREYPHDMTGYMVKGISWENGFDRKKNSLKEKIDLLLL